MLEGKLPHPRHHGFRPVGDEAPPAERGDDGFVDVDGRGPEHAADDGAPAQRFPRRRLEQVDARSDGAVHRIRNRDRGEPLGGDPVTVAALECALLHQHVQHLLDEERVALGGCQDTIADLSRHDRLAEQRGHEPGRIDGRERPDGDRGDILLAGAPRGARLQQLGSCAADEQEPRVGDGFGKVVDEIEQSSGCPVDVLQHQDDKTLAAECAEILGPGAVRPAHGFARIRRDRRGTGQREPDSPGDCFQHTCRPFGGQERLDRPSELLGGDVVRVRVQDPSVSLRCLGEGPVRASLTVRETTALEHPGSLETPEQLVQQARLADPRLPVEHHELRYRLTGDP